MTRSMINGPAGRLELVLEPPSDEYDAGILAVICHPHPLHGGTMFNKVVTTTARTLQKMGCVIVRFNYRGVGESEGEYGDAIGEVDDLLTVVAWAQEQHPNLTLWLAGFSFGAYVAAKGATVLNAKQLITIAPSVENMNYHALPAITIPWLVIQGDEDTVVSAQAVLDYVGGLNPAPDIIMMQHAGHFFHSRLLDLEQALVDNLDVSR